MGLDMYLYRKNYVQNWDYMTSEERHSVDIRRGGKPRVDIKPERISHVVEQIAYWRKANAIHGWFVNNVQNGVDDCREYYVSRNKLRELVLACKQLDLQFSAETTMASGQTPIKMTPENFEKACKSLPSIAEAILPTTSGCFFGSTEYDPEYLAALRYTIQQLEPLLADEDGEYYYQANW